MLLSLIAVSVVLVGWSLFARQLERWRLTAPMIVVLAGVAVGLVVRNEVAGTLNTDIAQRVAEIILAVLLFVDATDVRGGFLGPQPRSALRMLLIALPLSLALTMLTGMWLLPELSWGVLLVVACIVLPTDFAPAPSILRDRRLPERVRSLLNVEAGYNDGVLSPTFIFALALAGDSSRAATPLAALGSAVPEALKAILVGAAVGAAVALAVNAAERRTLMTDQSKRLILVAAPLLAYAASVSIGGNGFVCAFVCGLTFHALRRSASMHHELELVDDVGFLLSVVMWFAFGAATVIALEDGVRVKTVVFCVLALTVLRIVPVFVALLGQRFGWRERLLVGALGPRGTSSIVFGLLAFNALGDTEEHAVLRLTVVAVLGSVLLHGFLAPSVARAYSRAQTKLST